MNSLVKQDHRFIKRRVKPGLVFFKFFNPARRTLKGYEAMNMIRKGQIKGADKGDLMRQISPSLTKFSAFLRHQGGMMKVF